MTVNGYRGDTIAKKLVRSWVWGEVRNRTHRFSNAKLLALAGPEAADAGCALAFGASPGNITLIDSKIVNAVKSQWVFPEVNVRHQELKDFNRTKTKTNFAFLDFCSNLTTETLQLTTNTLRDNLVVGGHVALTFLCGREQPGSPTYELIMRAKDRHPSEHNAQMSRAEVVTSQLSKQLKPYELALRDATFFFYYSTTSKSTLPMGVLLGTLRPRADRSGVGVHNTVFLPNDPVAMLADEIYVLESAGVDPGLALNLSKGSIAAYKAHSTRGTYDK